MATSIALNQTTQDSKKIQRSITHIDPSATNADILAFAEGLNGLSTNTLAEVRRVDTTDLLNDTRADRNIQLQYNSGTSVTSIAYSTLATTPENADVINLIANGNPTPNQLTISRNLTGDGFLMIDWYQNDDNLGITLTRGNENTAAGTITFSLPGTENYKPASITLTIT